MRLVAVAVAVNATATAAAAVSVVEIRISNAVRETRMHATWGSSGRG